MTVPIPKLAGVCGWPIHHSLSPLMHNYWLRGMGIPGGYVHFAVRPDEAIRAFRSLRQTSITGVNVTVPLKALAFEAADIVTPEAERLMVANCLYKKDGQLIAHNTDMEGFATPLLEKISPKRLSTTPALVFGTGGAARAVVGALLNLNCAEIRVCGRTDSKAEKLSKEFNLPSVYAVDWRFRHISLPSAGLIINASSAGMKGIADLDLELGNVHPSAFIYDLVYTPKMTGFLKQAQKYNLPYIGGLEMLIAQARPSFRLFFGQNPKQDLDPRNLLEKALLKP